MQKNKKQKGTPDCYLWMLNLSFQEAQELIWDIQDNILFPLRRAYGKLTKAPADVKPIWRDANDAITALHKRKYFLLKNQDLEASLRTSPEEFRARFKQKNNPEEGNISFRKQMKRIFSEYEKEKSAKEQQQKLEQNQNKKIRVSKEIAKKSKDKKHDPKKLIRKNDLVETNQKMRSFMFHRGSKHKIYKSSKENPKKTWKLNLRNRKAIDLDEAIAKFSDNATILGISRDALLLDGIVFLDFDVKKFSLQQKLEFQSAFKKLQRKFKRMHIAFKSISGGRHLYLKTNILNVKVKAFIERFEDLLQNEKDLTENERKTLLDALDQVSTKFSSKQNIRLPSRKKSREHRRNFINVSKSLSQIKQKFILPDCLDNDTFPDPFIKGDASIKESISNFVEGKSSSSSTSVWHSPNLKRLMIYLKEKTIFNDVLSWNISEKKKEIIFASIAIGMNNSLGSLNNFAYFNDNFSFDQPDVHFRFHKSVLKELLNSGKIYNRVINLIDLSFLKKFKGNSFQGLCDLYELRENFFINGNQKDASDDEFLKMVIGIIHDGYKYRNKLYGKTNNLKISKDVANKISRLKLTMNLPVSVKKPFRKKNIYEYIKKKVKKNKNNKFNFLKSRKIENEINNENKNKFSNKKFYSCLSSSVSNKINIQDETNKVTDSQLSFLFGREDITIIVTSDREERNNLLLKKDEKFMNEVINC